MSTTKPNSSALALQANFEEISARISAARQHALQAVNTILKAGGRSIPSAPTQFT